VIGRCDCCERENVPVSHIDATFGIEAFACYLCQCEDDPDPYGELAGDECECGEDTCVCLDPTNEQS